MYKLALSPDLLDISYKGHGLPAPHTGENIDFDLIENNLQKLDMDYIKSIDWRKYNEGFIIKRG